jgi:ligand-binding sensor domain-containing protein
MRIFYECSIKILLIFFWQFLPDYGNSQTNDLRFEPVILSEGVPVASIGCIYEDSRRFMWFGGFPGLYLYDGYKLTHFQNDPDDPLSISDNKVGSIVEDNNGNFWIGTQNGLNFLDFRKKTFKRYNEEKKCGLGITSINQIKKDKTGAIWVTANGGLYKSDSSFQRFIPCFPDSSNKALDIGQLYTDDKVYFGRNGNFWVGDLKAKHYKLIPSKDYDTTKKQDFIGTLSCKDKQGRIWLGRGRGGLFYFNPDKDSIYAVQSTPSLKDEIIYFISIKNDAELWIGTKHGLLIFNTQTFKYERFRHNPSNPFSIPTDEMGMGFHSSNNTLWLTNYISNMYKVDMQKQRFQNISINLFDAIKSAPNLFDFYEYSPNVLLMPFKEGPAFFDIKTKEKKPFPYQPKDNLEGWKKGLTCFMEEADGKLWIGTFNGLFLFDKNTKRFIDIESQIKDIRLLRKSPIRKIHRDRKGNLWVSAWYPGVYKINFENNTFKGYYTINANNDMGAIASTRSILESKNGTIWVGTRGGLLKYMADADTFKIYKNDLKDPESLSENTPFCLYEDEKETLWVGTYGGGLNKMDVATGKFKHYSTKHGLIDNNVISIYPDKEGNLWLATFGGVSFFNPHTETFRNYTNTQGLINAGYSAFLYGKSSYSGLWFLGGDKGIDFFDPNNIQPSSYFPNIYITDFKLFNKPVSISRGVKNLKEFQLDEDITYTKHLTLRYEQNVIGFDFVALEYSSPKSIQYAYQLEGFDTTWQYVGNQRSATFTNLDPGNYTFKVKATNGDGIWGAKMATLKLTILPPWWQTWWFRILAFLTLFGLAYAFYTYRINQIKEKETIKTALNQRISEVEMEALRSQMSPHFIFNCLSAITRFILNHENEAATVYLTKFSRLVRLVLNHSQVDMIPLSKELDAINLYLEMESLRFHEKFKYIMTVDKKLDTNKINIPPMLIQPYLENAVWHGLLPKQSVDNLLTLDFSNGGESLTITIEDNGIGREKAAENKSKTALSADHKSFGMKLTEERIGMINKMKIGSANVQIIDLKNENSEALGTKVVLTIPIKLT